MDQRGTLTDERLEPGVGRSDRERVVRGADRRRSFSWSSQLQILVPLFIVWLGGFGVLGAVVAHGNFGDLFLDPAYVNGGVWYDGLVSQLGMVAWSVAVVSAAWSAWIAAVSGRRPAALFLLCGALVGGVLLADDLFGFHSLLPSFGVPKPVAEALVLLPLFGWLLRFQGDIARTRYPVLLASLGANAVSVLVDLLLHPGNADRAVLFEDGPKFLGILAWATYFVLTTRDIARSAMLRRVEPPDGRREVGKGPAPCPAGRPASSDIDTGGTRGQATRLWANESNERRTSSVASNDGNR